VDTNCDPEQADYPIAGNDDAIRSVRVILGAVGQAITQGKAEFESKKSRKAQTEAAPVEAAAPAAA
jgi:small subunit ribosomal protein S2